MVFVTLKKKKKRGGGGGGGGWLEIKKISKSIIPVFAPTKEIKSKMVQGSIPWPKDC